MTGRVKLQHLSADFPVFVQVIAVVFAVLLRSQTAESFQLIGTPFELAVLPQDFQLEFEIVYLRVHGVQLGEKCSAVSIGRDSFTAKIFRLDTILSDHILSNTGELHIATVDSVLNKLVQGLLRDNSDL